MKESKLKEAQPVIVLVAICLVVSLALGFTYKVANPIIIANNQKTADEARTQLLPDADGFEQVTDAQLVSSSDGKASVTEVWKATNDTGYVFTVETKSFGGTLTMMVGVDESGAITGVKVTEHSDTAGVGTKNFTDEHLGQYKGLTSLDSDQIKKDSQIDTISGASVTGEALHLGVYTALQQYAQTGGAQ